MAQPQASCLFLLRLRTAPAVIVAAKEEVRKAVAIVTEVKPEAKPEPKKNVTAEAKPKAPTVVKPKSATPKKPIAVATKKKTPPPPPKSQVERTIDRAVDSVRRFFR